MMAHADQCDDVERAVRLSVAAAAETVSALILPAAGGFGCHAADLGEGTFALDPLSIVAGGDEELAGELGAHAEERDQVWCGVLHEGRDLAAETLDLLVQVLPTPGQIPEGELGGCEMQTLRVVDELNEVLRLGRSRRHRFTNVRLVRAISSSRNGSGAQMTVACSPFIVRFLARTALFRVNRRVRIASTGPVLSFGIAVAVFASTARAACSASRRSDLPLARRAERFGRLTSRTSRPWAPRNLVREAPKKPVPSTPTVWTVPNPFSHAHNCMWPSRSVGNWAAPRSSPVAERVAAWCTCLWVSTPPMTTAVPFAMLISLPVRCVLTVGRAGRAATGL